MAIICWRKLHHITNFLRENGKNWPQINIKHTNVNMMDARNASELCAPVQETSGDVSLASQSIMWSLL
jgi:hypothetical protein